MTATIDLCFALPNTIPLAVEAFENLGWRTIEEDEESETPPPIFQTLMAGVIVHNFRADDLNYTVGNGAFMAASILGNSSLGKNQIGMAYGDASLAVLGIEEARPNCTMAGPAWISRATHAAGLRAQITQSTADLWQGMRIDDRGGHKIGIFEDFEAFQEDVRKAIVSNDDDPEEVDLYVGMLKPVSITVTPQASLKARDR
ncbi:hypothetical protein [Jannaschia donghaensis]|uniref:Uncharacterized protein n=1 Tax=Jannaschia donghaensis TaxID=420998 RepID=A0A0M6YH47_9RHOB|nr:hypothetical protein [Jannaschia donghaensis]CTQ49015.1 hypothetical protein JDO7802_01023 [Jannaschia donghaensis]